MAFNDAKRNADLSPAGKAKRALAEATKQSRAVTNLVANAISQASVWIRTKETVMTHVLAKPELDVVVSQTEIRGVLRAMGANNAYAAVVASLESGELRLAQAALAGPDLVCPLPDGRRAELDVLLKRAAGKNDPEFDQAQAIREGIVLLEAAYSNFRSMVIGLGKDAQAAGAEISDEFASVAGYDPNLYRAA